MNKKRLTILAIVLFMTIGYAALSTTLNLYGKSKLSENLEDFIVFLSSLKINGEEVEGINDTKDGLEILTPVNGVLDMKIVNDSTEYDTEAYVECETSTENSTNGLYDEIASKSLGSSSSLNYNVSSVNSSTNGVYQLADNNLIYFYRGKVDNNVIFNNFCWKIIRTTDTKGVKLLYNGVPTDGKCSNSGTSSEIGKSVFNTKNDDNAYVGYMYGTPSSTTYSATHSNQNSSVIKDTLETWYKDNMTNVTDKLEDAVYCNDRTMTTGTNNNVLGSSYGTLGYAKNLTGYGSLARSSFNTKTVSPNLTCTNDNDKFTVSANNGNGKLTYPIGLITTDEMVYGGHNTYYSNTSYYKNTKTYLYSGEIYWTMTPVAFMQPYQDTSKAIVSVESNSYISSGVVSASYGVRPVITLNSSQGISKGEGTENNPYIIGKAENTKTTITTDSQVIEAQDSKNVKIENLNTSSLTCKLIIKKISRTDKKNKYNGPTEWTFDYTGDEQTFEVPVNGTYNLETWGAQGGITYNFSSTGGSGAYASGTLKVNEGTKLYLYIGGSGENGINSRAAVLVKGGYNGGGSNGALDGISSGGGGATDIRLINGTWDDFASLKSRIMVAGGGGGGGIRNTGAAGGQNGGIDTSLYGQNGSQTAGGFSGTGYTHNSGSTSGSFGKAGNGGYYAVGAGGSGYYGGGGGAHITPSTSGGGGGGSSFISGHDGCDAISEESTQTKIIHTGQSKHYSGYVFTDTIMIDGNGYSWSNIKGERIGMPTHDGTTTMTGNLGNGYAKITLISID